MKVALYALLAVLAAGCGGSDVKQDPADPSGMGGSPADDGVGRLELTVSPDARSFVELSAPALVEAEGDGSTSIAWDLALEGREVYTNGGISGPGSGEAFGPLSAPTFLSDTAPEVPIMLKDRAGGALLDWYDYGGEKHQLFSRYHVYGLREGERYFKLQILSYYGDQLGAPVSALYHIRYAEVLADGVGETQEMAEIDATSGGDSANDDEPSACVDLDSKRVSLLTPAQAAQSDAWHLCFRREAIAVNGGLSGPRGVEAVDLQAEATIDETEAEIQARTAATEQELFDGIDYATLSDPALEFRPDGVATAFGHRWLEPGTDPVELSNTVWLVIAADGVTKYLMKFESLSGDLGNDTATLSLKAKAVR